MFLFLTQGGWTFKFIYSLFSKKFKKKQQQET